MSAYMIIDGQWGSCGKGLLAGTLAKLRSPDVVVNNFGPNAGHTFYEMSGSQKILTQQLPSGLVCKKAMLLIGPGSIINPDILLTEIKYFDSLGYDVGSRLAIHPRAAVVTPNDIAYEKLATLAISSTMKGVGSAIQRKISRDTTAGLPLIARDCKDLSNWIVDERRYNNILADADIVQIESAQGLELSINHGTSYPFCTSRDITVEAVLNDVGINRFQLDGVFTVVRTFPIRVGNNYDNKGQILGYSGPVYEDMRELSWLAVGDITGQTLIETTTVTGKTRRVFDWSWEQFDYMCQRIGPSQIFINFMNYLDKEATSYKTLKDPARQFVERVHDRAKEWGSDICALGFGPTMDDIYWLEHE